METLNQLKNRCVNLGLVKYGNKADLIRRINSREYLNELIKSGLYFRQLNLQENYTAVVFKRWRIKILKFLLLVLILVIICAIFTIYRKKKIFEKQLVHSLTQEIFKTIVNCVKKRKIRNFFLAFFYYLIPFFEIIFFYKKSLVRMLA